MSYKSVKSILNSNEYERMAMVQDTGRVGGNPNLAAGKKGKGGGCSEQDRAM